MSNILAIYGAGGHGKVVADIALKCGYDEIIFIDDFKDGFISFEKFLNNYKDIPVALGIGDNFLRKKIYYKLKNHKLRIKTIIHPNSIISDNVEIKEGCVIMPGSVINVDTKIEKGVIINSGSIIEHDCKIEDFVHIAPNSSLAGNVKIGELAFIGIGSVVIQNINIGKSSIVGAGSVVLEDVLEKSVVAGVPAKYLKRIDER